MEEDSGPIGHEPVKQGPSGTSDLLVRFVSAVAMIGLVVIPLWLGGWFWIGFVVLLAGLVLWEWNKLVRAFEVSPVAEVLWQFAGTIYVGGAAIAMIAARIGWGFLFGEPAQAYNPWAVLLVYFAPIVAVDVGAYFSGRLIGGPRIAPSISPSKTWAGLAGGAVAAAIVNLVIGGTGFGREGASVTFILGTIAGAIAAGILIAVIAQAGDFFESWMKRRAGVKDSSNLIPGHGGVFDRLDGFIAVFFILFLVTLIQAAMWPQ